MKPRISLQKTQKHMAVCLSPSFLVAIKWLSLLQLATLNTGHFMGQYATSTTIYDMPMEQDLFSSAFYQLQKVYIVSFMADTVWLCHPSQKRACQQCWLLHLLLQALPYIYFATTWITLFWWDNSWSLLVPQQALPMHNMGYRSIDSRLPWTGITGLYCKRLVCQVSLSFCSISSRFSSFL